jgi:hypothetical protein
MLWLAVIIDHLCGIDYGDESITTFRWRKALEPTIKLSWKLGRFSVRWSKP